MPVIWSSATKPGARKNIARTSETPNGISSGYQIPNSAAG